MSPRLAMLFAVCIPGALWFVLRGVVPANYWVLLPLGLWAWVGPLLAVWRSVGEEPEFGLRPLVQRVRTSMTGEAVALLVLACISLPLTLTASDIDLMRSGRFAISGLTAVPLALAAYVVHLAYVEAIRAYRVHVAPTLLSLLSLEVAARLILTPIQFVPVYEGLWLVAKGIGLHAWMTTLETRRMRGLGVEGLRAMAADAIAAPGRLDPEFVDRLRRLLRASVYTRYLPYLLSAAIVTFMLVLPRPNGPVAAALLGTILLASATLLLAAGELTAGLRKLLRRGILSELLLTPINPAEILAALMQRTIGPLCIVLPAHAVAVIGVAYGFDLQIWASEIFWVYFVIPLVAFVAVAALAGPLMNEGLRAGHPIAAIVSVAFRLLAVEAIVVALCIFCLIQGGMASLFDDLGFSGRFRPDRIAEALIASDGSFIVLGVSHLLVVLWIFVQWQKLLRDFKDLAHGNYERKDGKPFHGVRPEST